MAKTNAERQRDFRARRRERLEEARRAVATMPVADFEEFRAKARLLAEQHLAQIAGLEERVAELEEIAAGRRVPPCSRCGDKLACPSCYRGDDF